MIVADGLTTVQIQGNPGVVESNRVLGRNPSNESVMLYFGALILAHHLIVPRLPEKSQKWWLWGFSLYHGYLAADNLRNIEMYGEAGL